MAVGVRTCDFSSAGRVSALIRLRGLLCRLVQDSVMLHALCEFQAELLVARVSACFLTERRRCGTPLTLTPRTPAPRRFVAQQSIKTSSATVGRCPP